MPLGFDIDRRTLLKTTGAAGAASLLPFSGTGAAAETDATTVDAALDTDGGLQEVLVVFDSREDVDRLRHLEFAHDHASGYHKFSALPVGYTVLTGAQIGAVAGWPEVRYVEKNHEIELHNDDAREVTGADVVQNELFYTGETVHAVVVDSGVDGDHPDLTANLRANYRFVHPLDRDTMWVDAGPADTASAGHGTHCSGSIAGDGTQSDGQYKGMAPDTDLTVYSTDAAAALLNVVGAYDDMLEKVRQGKMEVQLVSNSFGASEGNDYSPNGSLELATWHAFEEGILPVFSAGNSGPGSNTLGNYAAGPHVLSVAATDDDMNVTDFSSRGRKPSYTKGEGAQYDRETALENLRDYHSVDFADRPVVGEESYSGTVGPGSADAGVGSSVYEKWTAPSDAGYVELEVSWTPQGQDIDVYLHEGAEDGPVVASGASLSNPETLSGAVESGTTYFLEIRPYANVTASYTVSLTAREALPPGREPSGPYGLYRIGVGAPGELVMSTLSPDDAWQAYATISAGPTEQDSEPWYGKLSGTSMSCPVTSGICALVIDAYRQTHGEYPDPAEVINIVEATAKDAKESHNPWNVGAGFVDAADAVREAESPRPTRFDDVDLAVDGEVTDDVFTASGSRADDGSAFTAGQTNQVDLTVEEASEDAVVRDVVPFDWEVVAGDPHTVYTDDGTRYVEFDEPASAGETRTYFVEAPDSTGQYEFGPAEARSADGGAFVRIAGTETNTVGGVSTNV